MARNLDRPLVQSGVTSSSSELPINAEFRRMLGDGEAFDACVAEYMESIDLWMPIIPTSYLVECVKTQPALRSSEQLLVLACVKLLTKQLDEDNACTKDYFAVKVAFLQMEVFGALTLRTAQARFLLLLYEYSHGINQAACISLSVCMGYLASLTTDENHTDIHSHDDWLIEEQTRRLWWAAFVLDRALSLGYTDRPLLVKEPARTKWLPSDQECWQLERFSPEKVVTLSSPPTPCMGSFRLLVLASDLLGLALEYRAEIDSQNGGLVDEVQQLYRTLCSFANVLEFEGLSDVTIGAARGIIHSAVFVLYPDHQSVFTSSPDFAASGALLLDPRAASAEQFLDRTHITLNGALRRPKETAPFLLFWGFNAFKYYYHAHHAHRSDESKQALQDITKVFWQLNQKWKLASAYMRLLSSSQVA